MFERLQAVMLRILRVPPEPAPPAGAPGSLRVFRAGRNYLRFKWVAWAGTQVAALVGIAFSLYFIHELELQFTESPASEASSEAAAEEPTPTRLVEVSPGVYQTRRVGHEGEAESAPAAEARRAGARDARGIVGEVFGQVAPRWMRDLMRHTPERALFWIKLAEAIGLIGFAVQFVWSFGLVWLDYSLRWYMVTDRSLRLRWGIVKIQESTMSFANLQQVSVHQGPLQRLLRLADVEVRSAGGGSGGQDDEEKDSMHRCRFHGVDNATEIRDLILERLKRFRQAGLGDHDDAHGDAEPASWGVAASRVERRAEGTAGLESGDTEAAARELLAEVRALRDAAR